VKIRLMKRIALLLSLILALLLVPSAGTWATAQPR
jgi:hypothetical protein